MKNIQIILNAILAKDKFEYVLVDREWKIIDMSSGFNKYFIKVPQVGDDIVSALPEFVGSEKKIEKIFSNSSLTYELESVYKNEQYVNISVEYYDENTLLVLFHNITDIAQTQQKLLQYSNESILLNNTLQTILDSQNALLFVTSDNEISYTNEQFLKYFNVKKMTDLRRKNLKIYKYLDATLQNYDSLFEHVNTKEEHISIHEDTFILKATWIEATHKLFTLTKITKMTNKMQLDALTGTYKKTYFNKRLEKIIIDKEQYFLVVIDIDDFKLINDTYGHQAGDDALKEFATLIKQNIRSNDLFSRWGGEEFLLLLQFVSLSSAMKKVEELRTLIEKHSFVHVENMTASFGLAQIEEDDDLHSFIQRADSAMYDAKKAGKNRAVFKKA